MLEVSSLVKLFYDVSHLNEYLAKTSFYYAAATHHLEKLSWFPILYYCGPPGTGKTETLKLMARLCQNSQVIDCHETKTKADLRDDLVKAKDGTALIEEAGSYPNQKELESYMINRNSRATSNISFKQVRKGGGWEPIKKDIFGATVVHSRSFPSEAAVDSRTIIIPTVKAPEGTKCIKFADLPSFDPMPIIDLEQVPESFPQGRILDTWEPLLRIASSLGDSDYLSWAEEQMKLANKELQMSQGFEDPQLVLGQIIELCSDNGMDKLFDDKVIELDVDKVFEPLRKQYPTHFTPQLVTKNIRHLGIDVFRRGKNRFQITKEQLRTIAKRIGLEDEALN